MTTMTMTTGPAAAVLPETPFIVGTAHRGTFHAIPRDYALRALAPGGGDSCGALCGTWAQVATRIGTGAFDRAHLPAWMRLCPACTWTIALQAGSAAIAAELEALTPAVEDLAALEQLVPDPLITRRVCEAILATAGDLTDGSGRQDVVELLAHAAAHAPVLLRDEDCVDTSIDCGHPGPNCPAAPACPACSVRAGDWAQDREGFYRDACTIAAPCQVIGAMAAFYGVEVTA
ncbi:hypothetical protein GCM10010156_49020 [Planobispora rosea]|uniref:Uncharacterized protein n=1 Tax=Planobispora rosea TaxID=35762 RepID=A0A8J3SAS6_PLARO|nr:hypothetical protein [Planobispora rosea]GGS84587.1 hypothetical protein GCM10010156_49020 [Planobispora rosea]GIH86413.1 hypothetical protein Pro02_48210 [Planobispora rosea]